MKDGNDWKLDETWVWAIIENLAEHEDDEMIAEILEKHPEIVESLESEWVNGREDQNFREI